MKLYTYYRSSASYRLRIALNLKGLTYASQGVHLGRGEHLTPEFRAVNPQARIPVLTLDDGVTLVQTPAIIEYLEEAYPEPPLLPKDLILRAQVRGVAAIIGCDIHPLNNSGPLAYLRETMARPKEEISAWIAHWIGLGFSAVEAMIGEEGFAFGAEPGLADVYIIPQCFNARRFDVPLDAYPRILRVEALAKSHPAFQNAAPDKQPDAE